MNKLFVSKEIAIKLKELGFNEDTLAFYNKDTDKLISIAHLVNLHDIEFLLNTNIAAPLYQQAWEFLLRYADKNRITTDSHYNLTLYGDTSGKVLETIGEFTIDICEFDNHIEGILKFIDYLNK